MSPGKSGGGVITPWTAGIPAVTPLNKPMNEFKLFTTEDIYRHYDAESRGKKIFTMRAVGGYFDDTPCAWPEVGTRTAQMPRSIALRRDEGVKFFSEQYFLQWYHLHIGECVWTYMFYVHLDAMPINLRDIHPSSAYVVRRWMGHDMELYGVKTRKIVEELDHEPTKEEKRSPEGEAKDQ